MANPIKYLFSLFLSYRSIRLRKSTLNFISILATAVILLMSIISYLQVQKLVASYHWITHTYQVIQATDNSLYKVVEIEAAQRAYLIDGNKAALDPIGLYISDLNKNLALLKQLTPDNPPQVQRILAFDKIIQQRLNDMNKIVQMKSENAVLTPIVIQQFEKNKTFTTNIKFLAREIKSVELILLDDRNSAAIANATTMSLILIFGTTISIAIFLFACLLANNEYAIRTASEKNKRDIESRMRNIIESTSDMIAAIDIDYKYILFNEAYQKVYKKLFGKLVMPGMSLKDILPDEPDAGKRLLDSWKASLDGNEYTKNIEFELDGEKNLFEVTSSSNKGVDGKIIGAVHIVRNITIRMQEQMELKESYKKLDAGMRALQEKNDQITLLVEMSDLILACNTQKELTSVISKYCQRILRFTNGYLYIMHPSKNYLEMISNWGKPLAEANKTFQPDQCWAIRLGRKHIVSDIKNELICDHIFPDEKSAEEILFCIPLMAQNDIYGLLYAEILKSEAVSLSENQLLLINAFAELSALALANVRLRENLRYQSIRDPLTGLYNRRYLEDFFAKQIYQSERNKQPMTVLMLDLDHFKKINDSYGHDAGDVALKELGKILQADIRVGDLAARFGGEEFIVILYNMTKESAKERAEHIRNTVASLQIKYGAQQIGMFTVSIGIAEYPLDGQTSAALIEAADKALYHAKNTGRNKIVFHSELKKELEVY